MYNRPGKMTRRGTQQEEGDEHSGEVFGVSFDPGATRGPGRWIMLEITRLSS